MDAHILDCGFTVKIGAFTSISQTDSGSPGIISMLHIFISEYTLILIVSLCSVPYETIHYPPRTGTRWEIIYTVKNEAL